MSDSRSPQDLSRNPAEAVAAAVAPAEAAAAALDAVALARLHDLDPERRTGIVQKVLATYDSSLATGLAALAAARDANDLVELRRLTHTLKSSSASVGALVFSALCGQAEHAARDGRVGDLPALLERLLSEGQRVQVALRAVLNG